MTKRVLGALTLALTISATASERPPAPGFSLPDTDGKTVTLAEYRGRLVLLAFTRCGSGRAVAVAASQPQ
ncbi:MAG: peroxiredoxin family protein [Thermoanaerobaculia bacterium]